MEQWMVKHKQQKQNTITSNLDVIISVGYRMKSIRGTQFRQWLKRLTSEDYMFTPVFQFE